MVDGFVGTQGGGWNGMTLTVAGSTVTVNGLFTRGASWTPGTVIGNVGATLAPPRRWGGVGIDVLSDGSIVTVASGAAGALVPGTVSWVRANG